MTREEFEQYAIKNGLVVWSKEQSESAIKALEELPKRRKEAKRWKARAAQSKCEDAVSRQAALKMLDEIGSDFDNPREAAVSLDGIVDMIEDLPSVTQKQNGWIPVSERLPKSGEYVGDVAKYYLVQNEYGDMLVARYTHSGYWEQIYQLKPIGDEIVAWMPLPKSYTEESEEQG